MPQIIIPNDSDSDVSRNVRALFRFYSTSSRKWKIFFPLFNYFAVLPRNLTNASLLGVAVYLRIKRNVVKRNREIDEQVSVVNLENGFSTEVGDCSIFWSVFDTNDQRDAKYK